ncbi:hypothetical protein CVT25_009205 [Psilocybe cyanescens]|uniref:pyranose dehydrogenase (acceptor) n=1 Tax=Psilocybe cyanescens TaxID=93625 RepID=A0A409WWC6_PSICY|nr:hypothetical protein CVT25_009205 [Psilocybe cyanescens]
MAATIDQVSGKTDTDSSTTGGGASGLTLATRLSEDPALSVLLLEAGAANLEDPAILTPAAYGSHFGNPEYDWAFATEPQANANGRAVPWPRGKGLGGSSAINFFQYHLATKGDYDAIEKLGNPGWNWELFKKYQLKTETFIEPDVQDESINYDLAHHGKEGPLAVSHAITLSGLEKPFNDSVAEFGIKPAKEPLSGDNKGTWLTPLTIHPKNRIRSYAANAYYPLALTRKNITVLTNAHVVKLESTKDANGILTATGVTFLHNKQTHLVSIGKEVVLSAGTIIDPQILELSGIGDKKVLDKFNIEVKLDLPGVGNNIQEHVFFPATHEIREEKKDQVNTFDSLLDPVERAKQIELFHKEGKGLLGMAFNVMAFATLSQLSPDTDAIYTELEKTIEEGIASGKYSPLQRKQYQLQLDALKSGSPNCEFILTQGAPAVPGLAKPGKKYVSFFTFLNHPFSRGTIHIKSTDPLEHPAIDPHYFEEKYDIRLLMEVFKYSRRLAKTEPLKSYLQDTEVLPGPECQTDEQIANTIGSCSLVPLADGGVVDTKLKVYNTTNIRVVDVSILPLHIGAHLQATAFTIGELGADIIKGKI